MLAEVQALAGYLSEHAGVGDDDRVILYLQNSPQYIIAYYAVLAANAVVVPVNPMSRSAELNHIATDSGAQVMFLGLELIDQVRPLMDAGLINHAVAANYGDYVRAETDLALPAEVRPGSSSDTGYDGFADWHTALTCDADAPRHNRGPESWCAIPYSSGTTGQPKGCLHTHATTNAITQAYPTWIPMPAGTRVLATLPLYHVTGMQNSMLGPIYTGSTIVLMTRWQRETAAQLIERYKIQHWRSITTMVVDFVAMPDVDKVDLSSITFIGGGGAQMPEAVAVKLKQATGLDYVEAYGLSETMAPTHINPPEAAKPQCLGIPIFGVDSRIIDPDTLKELGPNEEGEIISSGPQVFAGYWQQPEATAEVFLDIDGKRFLRTGDIGYYDEDGYFFHVDRLKRMVNVGGLKVWPAEVEALLYAHPAIKEACIVGKRDDRLGEVVKAVIVLAQDADAPDVGELEAWCRERMAAYKVPRAFEFTQALPRSGVGKILWRELQER